MSEEQHPVEIELKLELPDAAALASLRGALGAPERDIEQHNYYFDCHDRRWAKARWSLRLRRVDDRWWLTAKGQTRAMAGWTERPEYEFEIDAARAQAALIDGEALRALTAERLQGCIAAELLEAPLRCSGELVTQRAIYRRGEGRAELALDRSSYPDGSVVYEVELECGDRELGAREADWLRAVFAERGIAWRPSSLSKLARLLGLLGRGRNDERGP